MSTHRPSMWRVFLAIWRVGLLRWTRRLLGRLKPLKRRPDLAAKRQATPRKGGWSPVLAAMLAIPFLFLVVNNSSQLLWSLARQVEQGAQTGQMEISPELYGRLASKELDLTSQGSQPASQSAPSSQATSAPQDLRARREQVLAKLRDKVDREFHSSRPDRHGGGESAKQRFIALYLEHGLEGLCVKDSPQFHALPHPSLWPQPEHTGAMLAGLAVVMTAVFLFALANALHASQDVAAGRWDMEWLFTLPLPARTIFLADLAKETVSNPASWVIPLPFMWVALFCAGYAWWWSIPLAVACAAFVVVLVEAVRLPVEVYLRQRFRPDRLRNLFAAFGILGVAVLITLVTMATSGLGVGHLARLARALPAAVIYVPWALPLVLCHRALPVPLTLGMMLGVAALAVYAAGWLAERAVRRGLVAQGSGLIGRRRAARPGGGGLPLRGVVGKELLLLARDRNYLVRTLILPVGLAVFQVAINPTMLQEAQRSGQHASALAFGLSAYMLLMSGTRLLIHEGQGLWLLYTFPKTLDRILLGKAALWSAAAATLAVVVLIGMGAGGASGPAALLETWVTVLAGVGLFGMISAAVGALACDPMETRQSKQVPAAAMYLLMLMAGLYASCFYVGSTYAKAVTVVIFALVAVAFWQKARAKLPYLLDPVSRPPPSLDVADALIAAFAFFTVAGVVTILLLVTRTSPGQAFTLGYSLAAVAVGLLSMLALGARRIPGFLSEVGLAWPKEGAARLGRGVLVGLGLGLAAAGLAAAYLWVVSLIPSLRPYLEAPSLWSQAGRSDRLWLVLLFVVAAPVFEEYLFRGLLLRSLQRHTGPVRAAVFSSAVFGLMHSPVAFFPVFVLGLAAAVSFRRGSSLLAPIVAHMVYNALLALPPMLAR